MSWPMSHGPQVCGNPACPLCSPYLARASAQGPAAPPAWPESAPDLTRKVLGYRLFMTRGGHALSSVGVPNLWRPGVNDARCLLPPGFPGGHDHPHHAPHPRCACGLYAYHRPMAVWGTREYGFDAAGGLCTVAAVTLSWGRVEVHHDGVRAEHAEILALITPRAREGARVTDLEDLESTCCRAPVTVAGDTTHFYVCTACDVPCDVELAVDPDLGELYEDDLTADIEEHW